MPFGALSDIKLSWTQPKSLMFRCIIDLTCNAVILLGRFIDTDLNTARHMDAGCRLINSTILGLSPACPLEADHNIYTSEVIRSHTAIAGASLVACLLMTVAPAVPSTGTILLIQPLENMLRFLYLYSSYTFQHMSCGRQVAIYLNNGYKVCQYSHQPRDEGWGEMRHRTLLNDEPCTG